MKIARDKKVIWQIDQFHLLQVLDVEAAIQQRKSEVEKSLSLHNARSGFWEWSG